LTITQQQKKAHSLRVLVRKLPVYIAVWLCWHTCMSIRSTVA